MTYDTVIVCVCGASLHDNAAAREGHEDFWHSERHPAEYTQPNATDHHHGF